MKIPASVVVSLVDLGIRAAWAGIAAIRKANTKLKLRENWRDFVRVIPGRPK